MLIMGKFIPQISYTEDPHSIDKNFQLPVITHNETTTVRTFKHVVRTISSLVISGNNLTVTATSSIERA